MSRRQVLVQLDDELVERLDALARTRGTNRSALLRQGALAVLDVAAEAEADRQLAEAYRRIPQDADLVASASRLAAEHAPPW